MTHFHSDFLTILQLRGFIHQGSDLEGLDQALKNGRLCAYIGFDATAPSLHVGNLMGIMMLAWFQKCGHTPMTLVGGGTTRIGDPSGKDEARKLIDDAAIDCNIESLTRAFSRYIAYDGIPNAARMLNNRDWLKDIDYLDFLRDYGRHFSINRMLTFDSVRLRLEREQPLTFLEFNYMILQAYDFWRLYQDYGIRLQMGGSDQWGNIINGVELSRRLGGKEPLFALTCPLLTTSSGAKMGKSVNGAIWLNPDMLSPYDYYQFWRNTEDADVIRFLKYYTFLPLEEIARLEKLEGADINEAKKILASEATALCHGRQAADEAAATAQATFGDGGAGAALPRVTIAAADLENGIDVVTLLTRAGLATSNGEARRLIQGGGVRVNNVPLTDALRKITTDDMQTEDGIKLSAGKKRHVLIVQDPV